MGVRYVVCWVGISAFLSLLLLRTAEAGNNEHVEVVSQPGMSNPATASQTTPSQARAELQRLLDQAIFVASQQLNAIGTFYPYAAVMKLSGEIKLIGVPSATEAKPSPKQTIKALKKALSRLVKKRSYRAVAIFADFVAKRNDTGMRQAGIRVELEHRLPDNLSVFLPYRIETDGAVLLMTPQYMPGTLAVMKQAKRKHAKK